MSNNNNNSNVVTAERMGEDEVIARTKYSDPDVSRISSVNGTTGTPNLPQIEHLMRRVMKEENQVLLEEVDRKLAAAEQRIVSRITAHMW